MKGRVSIGLCVKNAQRTVGDTMKSLVSQHFPADLMELIIVDDGSVDKTLKTITDLISKTTFKTKICSTNGRGLGKARQLALEKASGEYILWVDGDIVLPPNHVQKQVEFMDQNPSVGKARGKWGEYKGASLAAFLESMQVLDVYPYIKKTSRLTGIGGSICRTNALKQAGGFDECIRGSGEDIDIAIRIEKKGWSLAVSEAKFLHKFRESWKALWDQYFWYGYGGHYVHHKHGNILPLWHKFPSIALMLGLRRSLVVYRLTNKKIVFLLPFQYAFKSFAWCFGFLKGHLDRYEGSQQVHAEAQKTQGD